MMNKNSFLKTYKNLKVLVTGTTGFKGSWLSFWLNNLGAKVSGLSLKPEINSLLFKSLNLEKKIDQFYIDIREFNKLNTIVKKIKPDIIFHLAAQSIVSSSYTKPLKTFETNVLGSVNMLETFRINNVPNLVFITSDKCYLNLNKKKNYKETDTLGGFDNYSSSKASAELIFYSYFKSYFYQKKKLTMASTRAGNVIGGGDMKENRIIPDIIRHIYKKKKLIIRNPNATRPWQHVLEPLSGYLLIGHKLLNKKLDSKLFPSWNFGPKPINCKNVEFVKELVFNNLNINNSKIKTLNENKFYESQFLSLNIQKSKKELNWKPRLDLNKTVKLTTDWYEYFFKNENIGSFTEDQINFFLDN